MTPSRKKHEINKRIIAFRFPSNYTYSFIKLGNAERRYTYRASVMFPLINFLPIAEAASDSIMRD
jgi:hypothetical protein